MKTIYGTFGVEMRAYGQKLVQFCTHTHTRVSFSSIDRSVGRKSCHIQRHFLFPSSRCIGGYLAKAAPQWQPPGGNGLPPSWVVTVPTN